MNPYIAIPLSALFINIVITTFVFARNHRTPVNRAFVWVAILFSLWTVFDVVIWSPIKPEWIVPLMKTHAVVYNFIGIVFVNFAYIFVSRSRDALFYIFAVMPFVALIIIAGTDLIIAGYRPMYWGNAVVGGPWYLPFATINGGIPIAYSVVLLVQDLKNRNSPAERRRLVLFLTGTTIGLATGFTSFVLLPHGFGINVLPVHSFSLIIFLLSVYIAITKYRFLAISVGDAASELFSSTRNGVVILNTNDGIVQHNGAARSLLAGNRGGSLENCIQEINRMFRENENNDEIDYAIQNDSDRKYVSVSRNPINHSSQQIGTLLFINDITAQKKAEELIVASNRDLGDARDQALQANRTKSAFLANMSHELRTPLNAIIGYSELLREDANLENKTDHIADLDRIYNAGHQLLALINDILDLSKIEAGKMELFHEQFSISGVVNEAEFMIKEKVYVNNNLMIVHCSSDIGNMVTDRMRLLQVLNNLLSNALKFTHDGKITLDVFRENKGKRETIVFRIIDTGIGMTQEQQKNLFQYFTQADPSATRRYGGSGLGLAISQQFSRLMGGEIHAISQLDKGSEFTVRLPAEVAP